MFCAWLLLQHAHVGTRGVFARGNQTGKVCHINMQICTNHVGDFAHTLKVDLTWDRRTTCDDQLWVMLFGQGFDLVISTRLSSRRTPY